MNEEEEFIEQYMDDFQDMEGGPPVIISENPEVSFLEDESLDLCWRLKVLKICIKKISAGSVVVALYLAGRKIATATLNAKKPCVKIKESAGGDAARVNVEVCANFGKKELRAKGKVCASFICVKFNQRILKW